MANVQFACYMVPSSTPYAAPLSTFVNSVDYPVFVPSVAESPGGCFYQRYNDYSQEHQFARTTEDRSNWSARLLAGGEQREQVLGALRGKVAELAFQQLGCHIVQDAIQVASTDDACRIANELQGHVQAAAWSPHANYVIQKVIEVLPSSLSGFVAQEFHGVAGAVARVKYGCRILCRIF